MTRVLVVDDKETNRYLLRVLLQGNGYEVEEAHDGAEALARARARAPDLVISDLLMPVMDGYTLLRQWKDDEQLRSIPFVVYTATYTEPKDERLALDLGADAFIIKPAEPEPFVDQIREVLAQHARRELSPTRPPAGDPEASLKHYGEVLFLKLEARTAQLERANRELSREVEERKSAEETLRRANCRKDQFLAMLSHELRNPLAPIRNSVFLLERVEPGGARAKQAITVIGRQVVLLTRLIDDLLDAARIASGKIEIRREHVDLAALVRSSVEDHRAIFAERGVELRASIAQPPMALFGDPERIAQLVGNLLDNAAKFTPKAGRAEVVLDRDDHVARLQVSDNGIGIAPDVLERIFRPFAQADTTLARSRGGLGLGLALVKTLVDCHGGTVTAASEGLGKGATFTVTVPLEAALAASAGETAHVPERTKHRILVIEDNVDAAESLSAVLTLEGHEVAVAHSGPEGIEKARGFKPGVLLCDIGLPEMNGYEVARRFRGDLALKEVFLVALTGYATPDDRQRAAVAGFDRHVAKPPSPETLAEVLAAVPQRPTEGPASA